MKIVILAGGSGTRLFPLSRACHPKQFLHVAGEKSLFQQTIIRFLEFINAEDIIILTNSNYLFTVEKELNEIDAGNAHIICEPMGRNTAPAIALAISYCLDKLRCDSDEVLLVTPSDHLVQPKDTFQRLVLSGKQLAKKQYIVTLGIVPTKPETGYGYIRRGKLVENGYTVDSFKEKPSRETAEKYINSGEYYWNSGMFMFCIDTMKQELQKFNPDIAGGMNQGYTYLMETFGNLPDISIDYAVAEKSDKMAVLPMDNIYWNDIGSFDAISEVFSDENGDVLAGDLCLENCKNTMILGGNDRLICGIDLDNLIVVDTPDALLVAKKGETQKVKNIVNQLKADKRKEVYENVTMHRPWGSYTVLAEGEGYKVKRITVNPGQKLSLQLHYHRSEHWTVISGTGKCTLDDKTVIFQENESTYIPIGVKHRLENPGKIPLAIIEVQNGKYLGEDDIVRFDDVYGRAK